MEQILKDVKERNVEVVRLWFTDVVGTLKGLNITADEVERALDEGIVFDGSSVEGFVRIEESDLVMMPDPCTWRVLPESLGGYPTGVLFCDIYNPDGTPYESDPRQVLRNHLQQAARKGYRMYVGPELEYFYLPSDREARPLDASGYFEVLPLSGASLARKETVKTLRDLGVKVEGSHHEVAESQHEVDFRYGDALELADTIQLAKVVVKEVATKHGIYATFMPKPIFGINGTGMHVHQSLFETEGDTNAFFGGETDYNLSSAARGYLAGLLHHAPAITSITNQWVNSYKRLVVGYEAPVYISWGRKNRSALVRVPAFKNNKPKSCRVEYRAPDPGANPYLCFAVMLAAGLDGMEQGYELPDPVEADIFHMNEEERNRIGIASLPGDLNAAIEVTERSGLVKEALGKELFYKFIANKKAEWERYRVQVTDYEIREYLPRL